MERITRAAAALGFVPDWGRVCRYNFIVLLLLGALLPTQVSFAATVSNASLSLSDPQPYPGSGTAGTGVSYTFTGTVPATAAIKCIKLVFATTATGSTVPTGMVTTSSTFNTGGSSYVPTPASWSLDNSTNGTLKLTYATGETPTTGAKTVLFNAITNGSVADTNYWVHFNTYNNTDCATSPVDTTDVQFIFTNGSQLSLTVDPSLSFSVSGVNNGDGCDGTTTTGTSTATTLPFGAVTTASNSVVCQDLTAATNATNGYTVYLRYTGKPQNATLDEIADHSGSNASPTTFSAAATEAYGYTTNDATLGTGTANRFTSGGQKWAAATTANAEVAFSATGTSATAYRIGHQVGISTTTPGGTYSTTVIYTCTPVY